MPLSGVFKGRHAMDQLKDIMKHVAAETETVSSVFVPPFQLTEGQPEPIAANGGLSYMAFDQGGDGGTAAAMEAALIQIAEGEGQAVTDMLDNAPPAPSRPSGAPGFVATRNAWNIFGRTKSKPPRAAWRFRCATRSTSNRPTPLFRPTHSGGTRRARPR